jgi:hypothetical protein
VLIRIYIFYEYWSGENEEVLTGTTSQFISSPTLERESFAKAVFLVLHKTNPLSIQK